MVILGLPGAWLSGKPHPSEASAHDNAPIDGWVKCWIKYSDRESTACRLHSSSVQHRSARLHSSSIRGVSHDDNVFPRDRDRVRIPALDKLRVRAVHGAGYSRSSYENGACGKEGREAADRGVSRMLEGSRCQEHARQGAQEVHVRMQEDCGWQGDVIAVAAIVWRHLPSPGLVPSEPGDRLQGMIRPIRAARV